MESSVVKNAILGVVAGGDEPTGQEALHLMGRKTTDFSSEIRNSLKNLGVVKSVVGTPFRIKIVKSIEDGVEISKLVRMVSDGTVK